MFRMLSGIFSSMSLERKCLLFFGAALLLLMFFAFSIVEVIAQRLVSQKIQQSAKDYANTILAREHWRVMMTDAVKKQRQQIIGKQKVDDESLDKLLARDWETLDKLDVYLLKKKRHSAEVIALDEGPTLQDLRTPVLSTDLEERSKLEDLERRYRDYLTRHYTENRPNFLQATELDDNDNFMHLTLQPLFEERGPVGDRYIFYDPIFFKPICMTCHTSPNFNFFSDLPNDEFAEQLVAATPFRAVRVSMPYKETEASATWIRAVVMALAMLIIAITLAVLHMILRYLVLHPLQHLRDVSDSISRGNTELRAEIDTEDEFNELADAFNRMLRHLTETQDQLREVNRELDQRVDQLAQLNLQLYEANRLKSDFLANMSHELRTPLNSIIGFSDVLKGLQTLTEKQRNYASNIEKSGRVLLEMINDILDLAKVEAGKMEVRPTRFDLVSVVSLQCDMVRSLSNEKNIDLSIESVDDLPLVYQDQNKIGQILTNLLGNAIKFTPEGGLITAKIELVGADRFRLLVTDTGIGIPEDDQKVIFEKFRQSKAVLDNDGLTREFSGTGLGLSIVKELCKLLGGEVTFTSELGRGSTFIITLPFELRTDQPAAPSDPMLDSIKAAVS
ncbi:Signal transduction histidine-protein kinase BarA [Rosistilla carotiformis]|uniref:histidine kinase n=1 Tax=Rosistilla carotiformis TaxID=2528017 RepID=A0A518JT72_9BACT|nr:ATP-binding protein [Rosistilla carotiformis]QDV68742.1 Signal transduction histidine-protein kinase BarA [Rosistilla carotiformis]